MSTLDPAFRQPNKWQKALSLLKNRTFVVMLLLGFSSGLPFMLVGNTMGFWLREQGTDLTTIGFLSWVGFAYSMKFLWSPIVDRVKLPFLNPRLGHRRSWLVLSQVLIGVALFCMAIATPNPNQLTIFIVCALVAAFASATQDIVVDAWRIESSEQSEQLALLPRRFVGDRCLDFNLGCQHRLAIVLRIDGGVDGLGHCRHLHGQRAFGQQSHRC